MIGTSNFSQGMGPPFNATRSADQAIPRMNKIPMASRDTHIAARITPAPALRSASCMRLLRRLMTTKVRYRTAATKASGRTHFFE